MQILLREDLSDHSTLKVAPFMTMHNPQIWQALLRSLRESPLPVRKSALSDINALLHGNIHAVLCLVESTTSMTNVDQSTTTTNWQAFIIAMLSDLPKNHQTRTPEQKSCFALTMNIFTTVHYLLLLSHPDFEKNIIASIDSVLGFSGSSTKSSRVISLLLFSLLSKVLANPHEFDIKKPNATTRFQNLVLLLRIIKRFAFETGQLNEAENRLKLFINEVNKRSDK